MFVKSVIQVFLDKMRGEYNLTDDTIPDHIDWYSLDGVTWKKNENKYGKRDQEQSEDQEDLTVVLNKPELVKTEL